MKLYDLLPKELLWEMIAKDFIKARRHPTLPLVILNYSEQAQFSRTWNDVTLNCRGLIYNVETGEIVARPFKKFFNDQENPRQQAVLQQGPVEVTDKLDGSLGILYPTGKGTHMIATRGSFTSDQAFHATNVWHEEYEDWVEPPAGWTLLFEIIYPANRIVVDYGGWDDIVLLGGVHTDTGEIRGPESFPGWPGPRAEVFPFKDYGEVLTAPLRPGKEGFVLRWPETGFQLKLKQQDYVELHRIVTGLNERAIWERLKDGRDPFEGVPDELYLWVKGVVAELNGPHSEMSAWAQSTFNRIWNSPNLSECATRRDFAEKIKGFEPWLKTCMFLILDNKDINPFLWKELRPAGETKRARPGPEDVK